MGRGVHRTGLGSHVPSTDLRSPQSLTPPGEVAAARSAGANIDPRYRPQTTALSERPGVDGASSPGIETRLRDQLARWTVGASDVRDHRGSPEAVVIDGRASADARSPSGLRPEDQRDTGVHRDANGAHQRDGLGSRSSEEVESMLRDLRALAQAQPEAAEAILRDNPDFARRLRTAIDNVAPSTALSAWQFPDKTAHRFDDIR